MRMNLARQAFVQPLQHHVATLQDINLVGRLISRRETSYSDSERTENKTRKRKEKKMPMRKHRESPDRIQLTPLFSSTHSLSSTTKLNRGGFGKSQAPPIRLTCGGFGETINVAQPFKLLFAQPLKIRYVAQMCN
jgi:hypothetical protein